MVCEVILSPLNKDSFWLRDGIYNIQMKKKLDKSMITHKIVFNVFYTDCGAMIYCPFGRHSG
jgi:hypothetical protein